MPGVVAVTTDDWPGLTPYGSVDTILVGQFPPDLLAEREALGLDRRDEVWDGEYHMVPPHNNEHGRVEGELHAIWRPVCRSLGLEVRIEVGVFDPAIQPLGSWCVPDVSVYRPEVGSDRGIEGSALLVVEVRSPGDDSYKKLPFYERHGVGEVLIIGRDRKWVRRWKLEALDGDERRLVEQAASVDEDGVERHCLDGLPVGLRTDTSGERPRLVVETPEGDEAI